MERLFVIDEQGNRREVHLESQPVKAKFQAEKKSFPWHLVIPGVSLLLNIAQAIMLVMDKV